MKILYYTVALVIYISVFFAQPAKAGNVVFDKQGAGYKNCEIIVKFREEVTDITIREICRVYNLNMLSYHKKAAFYRFKISCKSDLEKISGYLNKDPRIDFAHPDYYMCYYNELDLNKLQYINKSSFSKPVLMPKDAKVAFIGNSVNSVIYNYENGEIQFKETLFLNRRNPFSVDERKYKDTEQNKYNNIPEDSVLLTVSDIVESIYLSINSGGVNIVLIAVSGPHSDLLKDAVAYAFNRGVTVISPLSYNNDKHNMYPCGYENYCIAVKAIKSDNPVLSSNSFSQKTIAVPDYNIYDLSMESFDKRGSSFLAAFYVTDIVAALYSSGINGPDAIKKALFESSEKFNAGEQNVVENCLIVNSDAALNFYPEEIHDLAFVSLGAPQWCLRSEDVKITLVVKNEGDFKENGIVRLRNKTSNKLIGTKTVIIEPGIKDSLEFIWCTDKEQFGNNELIASVDIPEEMDLGDNYYYSTVNIQQDKRDVAIFGIEPVLNINTVLNNTVPVLVNIANLGTYTEMITVTLKDSTKGALIGTIDTFFQANEQITVIHNWNTNGIEPGLHRITADISTIDNLDSDPQNNHASIDVKISKPEIQKAE